MPCYISFQWGWILKLSTSKPWESKSMVHDAKNNEFQILEPHPLACPEGDAIQRWLPTNNTNPRKDILLRKTVNRASGYLQPS